jgi:hypothetical protein
MSAVGLAPGAEYVRKVAYRYEARWSCKDVPPSTDPTALPFGPMPFQIRQRQITSVAKLATVRGLPPTKPVLYVPVKRTVGVDKYPTLVLQIRLIEAGGTQNHPPPGWAGTTVKVDVVNVVRTHKSDDKLALTGTLDKNLTCTIEVPPATVEKWLHRSPLVARINENLLDFRFEMPGVQDGGAALLGQSANRVFLYCRKTIVFLPGLFGSQVQFTTPAGEVYGFPDFFRESQRLPPPLLGHPDTPLFGHPTIDPATIPDLLPEHQNAAVLECDDAGEPLVPANIPKLLMLSPMSVFGRNITDPFTQVHRARLNVLPRVPETFRLYTLIIYPYDWRLDLTKAAKEFIATLHEWQQGKQPSKLKPQPDTDDQFVAIGHSTGGVIIRRALAEKEAETLISQAFFLSVPLSGAPKAGAVLLTGREVPFGTAQIPIIAPETLKSIALSMPIVYHLHTSATYGFRPATTPDRPPGSPPDIEADKKSLVDTAIESGFYSQPRLVGSKVATKPANRLALALSSREWNRLLDEYNERINGSVVEHTLAARAQHEDWFEDEIRRRGLAFQRDARTAMGWNAVLAANAKTFHQQSRAIMEGSAWKEKTFLFWGSCQKTPTLRQLSFSRLGTRTYASDLSFLPRRGKGGHSRDRSAQTIEVRAEDVRTDVATWFSGGKCDFSRWSYNGHELHETRWRLEWVLQKDAGDGTVPSDSQLAEWKNVAAILSTRAPGDQDDWPEHMDSTKSQYVWDSLVRIIHADGKIADSGVEHDTKLGDKGSPKVSARLKLAPKHEWLRFFSE